jgi:hypothetical protein
MKKTFRLALASVMLSLPSVALSAAVAQSTGADPLPPPPADPAIAAALRSISPDNVRADIAKLVSFGTRSTLSSMDTDLPPGQGILAAADWVESQYRAISSACGGCLEVKRDDFVEQPAPPGGRPSRFARPTRLVNVYAILHGTSPDKRAPWVLVTGHYDSRATDVMDSHVGAPGANDDASGVAVSLESARALSKLKFPGTIVFVAVAGEEQGLNGSHHLAQLAKAEGWPLEAVLNNDIVGGDTTPGETEQRKDVVRVFSENVPGNATPEQQRQILALGAENDSPSRQLAREIAELAPAYFLPAGEHSKPAQPSQAHGGRRILPAFQPVLVLRRDRYLRGGDHTSFNNEGFAAVRFTEWRENFNHQHQTVRTENGVEYGDLLKFVDFSYVANVARLNATTLATLASAPSEPLNVRILTHNLDNNTELAWEPSAFAPAGTTYEVVWRDTGQMLWTHASSAGAETHLTLDVSKDNVNFGVRAVDAAGHRSLAVAPVPARQ